MTTSVRTSVLAAIAGGLLFGALGSALAAPPFPTPPKGGLPGCKAALFACETELSACGEELAACEKKPDHVFPGDGQIGAPLRYTDNGDGTFTDENTGLMWEIKTTEPGIHNVDNVYDGNGAYYLGTSVTVFLAELNHDEYPFAGYRDWRLPTIKELHSLVDYSKPGPRTGCTAGVHPVMVSTDLPGETAGAPDAMYWSSTLNAFNDREGWLLNFCNGMTHVDIMFQLQRVRAVRG